MRRNINGSGRNILGSETMLCFLDDINYYGENHPGPKVVLQLRIARAYKLLSQVRF
jgi:hypothetical protein